MSPRLAGLSLEQHAGIAVALAEGFPMGEVLAQEGVTEAAFRRADRAWKKRLADDAREGGALFAAYQEKRAQAEDWLGRDVVPLDADLEAWLGFCALWSSAPDASGLLRRWGLTLADVGRIGRAWQKRLAGDAKLSARAAELRTSTAAPSEVKVGCARLRPFPWTTPARAPALAPAQEESHPAPAARDVDSKPLAIVPAVPSYLRADARPSPPPPRADKPLAPLPQPPKSHVTTDVVVLPRTRKTLPFTAPPAPPAPTTSPEPAAAAAVPTPHAKGAPPAPSAPSEPAPDPTGPFGTAVMFDVRKLLGVSAAPPASPPAPPLTLEEHAAMTLELTLRPGRIAEVLHVTGLDPATKTRLDYHYAALRRSSVHVNAAWEQAYRAAWSAWSRVPWPGPRRAPPWR